MIPTILGSSIKRSIVLKEKETPVLGGWWYRMMGREVELRREMVFIVMVIRNILNIRDN